MVTHNNQYQQTFTSQNPAVRYDQYAYLVGQGLPVTNLHHMFWNGTSLSHLNMFNSSLIDLLNHQQAWQKDTFAIISKLYDLQTQNKNDPFLADMHSYVGKGDTSFTNYITQIWKIDLTQHPELQLAWWKLGA